MTGIELLNEIEKQYGLKELLNRGLISPKVLFYRDIYNEVDANKRLGIGMEESVLNVCYKMKCERNTVYRAYRTLKK